MRKPREFQRFGQAAGLVELDVDHLVTLGSQFELVDAETGLVRAQGDRRSETLESFVGAPR